MTDQQPEEWEHKGRKYKQGRHNLIYVYSEAREEWINTGSNKLDVLCGECWLKYGIVSCRCSD